MMSDNWKKFGNIVNILFIVIYFCGVFSPMVRTSLGMTTIITTLVGFIIFALIFFKQMERNKTMKPIQILLIKICMVLVGCVDIFILFILVKYVF